MEYGSDVTNLLHSGILTSNTLPNITSRLLYSFLSLVNSSFNLSSSSITITLFAFSRSFLVTVPFPGPTSTTTSLLLILEKFIKSFSTLLSIRKC